MNKNISEWDDGFLTCEEMLTPQVQLETVKILLSNLRNFFPSDYCFSYANNEVSLLQKTSDMNGRSKFSGFKKTVIFTFNSAKDEDYSPNINE